MAGGAATIGGPFALTDGEGRRVTDAEAITGPTLVYFGYSFCPDVCPTDLSRNALAAAELAEKGTKVGQVFITDRPGARHAGGGARLRRGDRPGAGRADRDARKRSPRRRAAYKVYYRKNGDDPDYYLMDHSTFTYLDGSRDGVPRVLPLGGDPGAGGRIRWRAMPPVSDPEGAWHRRPVSPEDLGPDRSLLILDDDEPFLRRLGRAMEKRGFEVTAVDSVAAARQRSSERRPPAYAVVDLRLEDGNGLEVVGALRERRPDARIVVLTGYGAIASAVAAVKIGATDYLAKPADANDVTGGAAREPHRQAAAARASDDRRPHPLGAYPAGLRALRPQRLGDGAAAQHAPAHPAADAGQAQPEIDCQPPAARVARGAPASSVCPFGNVYDRGLLPNHRAWTGERKSASYNL